MSTAKQIVDALLESDVPDPKSLAVRASDAELAKLTSRESRMVQPFLDYQATKEDGQGLAPSSFVSQSLHGRAKQYSSGYLRALISGLERRVELGMAVKGTSKAGRPTYYPVR